MSKLCTKILPLMDRCQRKHWHCWLFLFESFRYRWQISFYTLELPYQLVVLCNDLWPPGKIRNLLYLSIRSHGVQLDNWGYLNFIVLSNRHRTNIIFLSKFFRQRSWHQPSSNMRRCCKMPLTIFSTRRRYEFVELHFGCGPVKPK